MPDEAYLLRIHARRSDVVENFGNQAIGHCVEIGESVALSYINDMHVIQYTLDLQFFILFI